MRRIRTAAALAALAIAACASRAPGEPPADEGRSREAEAGEMAAAPGPPEEDAPEVARYTVFAAGDVFLGNLAQTHIRKEGLDYPFARVAEEIASHDVAFANLESPITDSRTEKFAWKRFHLKTAPDAARSLESSGFDVVGLANNHMMDFGDAGLDETIENLDEMGIRYAGAGRDSDEARAPAVVDVGGTEVVFLAYCAWTSAGMHAREDRAGVASLVVEDVIADVERWKGEDRAVIVSLHWGVQHTDRATRRQIETARAIAEAGASAIVGHHPHRPQDVEVHEGVPIIYSLGNFLFGYYNPIYKNNIAAVLEMEGARVTGVRFLPVDGRNGRMRFQPTFLEGKLGKRVLGKLEKVSRRHGTQMIIEGDEARLVLE